MEVAGPLGTPLGLAQRKMWMWFGAFPGAFGLGRAQPQRRGTSLGAELELRRSGSSLGPSQ